VQLSNPSFSPQTFAAPVQTAQVAPTLLKALGLDPQRLEAVRIEGTQVLPGLPQHEEDWLGYSTLEARGDALSV
jgi:arylsulfatase A-like enzyme